MTKKNKCNIVNAFANDRKRISSIAPQSLMNRRFRLHHEVLVSKYA